MSANLIEVLKQIPDDRCRAGRRYPLWLVLLLVVMATVSGCQGYKALEEFGQRHSQAVNQLLGLSLKRLPSDTTFRRLLQRMDFEKLTQSFNRWARDYLQVTPATGLAMDGKSIKGTVSNYGNAYQNFVNIVSIYSQQQGGVVALQAFKNKHSSEIDVVLKLLTLLHLEGMIVSLDALHCQKKLCRQL